MCVDQCPIQLPAPRRCALTQVRADHVVQEQPVRIATVSGQQRQPIKAPAEPAGLERRPATGVRPHPSHHLTGDGHVLPEHRQLEVTIPLRRGEPVQPNLDRTSYRLAALPGVRDVQDGDPACSQRRQHLPQLRKCVTTHTHPLSDGSANQ